MANKKSLTKIVETIFQAKQNRRKELARLPFDKKIEILLELQKISRPIENAKNRNRHRSWDVE